MKEKYADFGDLLRQARVARQLSQSDVARESAVAQAFVSALERGVSLPDLLTFGAIWRLLEFDSNALVDALVQRSRAIPDALLKVKPFDAVRVSFGPLMVFGRFLLRARMERALTQQAVAFGVECSTAYLGRLEAGKIPPSIRLFARLRHCLGFDVERALSALHTEPPQDPFYAIGQLLLHARIRQGIEPVEVAKLVRCTLDAYRRFESGVELPSLVLLSRLHQRLPINGNQMLRAIWLVDSRRAA